MFYTWSRSESS